VLIADLNGEQAEAAAKTIAAETYQHERGIRCDVTDDAQVNGHFVDDFRARSLRTLRRRA
jgi:hypothetical protein